MGGRDGAAEHPLVNGGREPVRYFSLGGVGDDVVGEHVVGASHGKPYAVLVALEYIVGYLGIKSLHQRHSGIAVIMNIVACANTKNQGRHRENLKNLLI